MIDNFKTDLALSQIINQLSDSPNYISIIRAISKAYDDQDYVLNYISTIDVYTAQGVWLDLLGSIVGQGRKVDIDLSYLYFGFYDIDPSLGGFDSGRFDYEGAPSASSTLLGDEEYRKVIIAKASQNSGDVSLPSIIETLQNVFESQNVYAYNLGNARLGVQVDVPVSDNIIELIKDDRIIPRAAGVKIASVVQAVPSETFGFVDIDPQAQGFGVGRFPQELL